MAIRIGRTLPDREVPVQQQTGLWWALNQQIVPVIRELLRKLTQPPSDISWIGTDAVIDVGTNDGFIAATLTDNTAIALTNGFDGAQGYIFVKQDATGGWTLAFTADGRTILREDPDVDSNPNATPGSLTRYRYHFVTVDDVRYVLIERMLLL